MARFTVRSCRPDFRVQRRRLEPSPGRGPRTEEPRVTERPPGPRDASATARGAATGTAPVRPKQTDEVFSSVLFSQKAFRPINRSRKKKKPLMRFTPDSSYSCLIVAGDARRAPPRTQRPAHTREAEGAGKWRAQLATPTSRPDFPDFPCDRGKHDVPRILTFTANTHRSLLLLVSSGCKWRRGSRVKGDTVRRRPKPPRTHLCVKTGSTRLRVFL